MDFTDNNRPSFSGTATPGSTVTVIATPTGGTTSITLGQAVVPSTGIWIVTPAQPLADGSYSISAGLGGSGVAGSVIQILPMPTEGNLVIATVGPRIDDVTVRPPSRRDRADYPRKRRRSHFPGDA